MEPLRTVTGVVAPLLRDDVDTDAIIPAIYMRSLATDPAQGLFAAWRYREDGSDDPSFVLNELRFRDAKFLLAGRNFGCGSSRENAVWALRSFGIRAVIALGFSDIFHENACKSGLLPIVLPPAEHGLIAEAALRSTLTAAVDVATRTLTSPPLSPMRFALESRQQVRLLLGQDEIAETLARQAQIERFQSARRERFPWLDMTGASVP
jgi:3-isopropylmalate/(R)-2-methylmalate dehydratase small subunit